MSRNPVVPTGCASLILGVFAACLSVFTGVTSVRETGSEGHDRFDLVAPGTYAVRVESTILTRNPFTLVLLDPVTVEGERRDLEPLLQDGVYRIARELLRNAFRQAQAGGCAGHWGCWVCGNGQAAGGQGSGR